jgi:hypothetical protein
MLSRTTIQKDSLFSCVQIAPCKFCHAFTRRKLQCCSVTLSEVSPTSRNLIRHGWWTLPKVGYLNALLGPKSLPINPRQIQVFQTDIKDNRSEGGGQNSEPKNCPTRQKNPLFLVHGDLLFSTVARTRRCLF